MKYDWISRNIHLNFVVVSFKQLEMSQILHTLAGVILLLIVIPSTGRAQEKNKQDQPDVRWDVHREYDESGNLQRYDSTWSWSWSNHDFGDHVFDSLFGEYFGDFPFPDSLFEEPFGVNPFMFPGFPDDSMFMSPFNEFGFPEEFMVPHGFNRPDEFSENWMERHRDMWERHMDIFRQFRQIHPFPDDSLHRFNHPQHLRDPGHRKNTGREVVI